MGQGFFLKDVLLVVTVCNRFLARRSTFRYFSPKDAPEYCSSLRGQAIAPSPSLKFIDYA
ncbi:hypothetical protein [Picosynechococcus sp. PCC 8807]|uniref:hypothetical protein n=1 Tax=Picosynechococcus sp. PCC 8807 TaxID=195248 RepID=UPI0012ED8304|nr:hypothetical protein [Picosynechococcus sp. PCC 8807]